MSVGTFRPPQAGPSPGGELRCSTPAPSSGNGDETPLPAPEAVQRRIFATEVMGRQRAALTALPPRSRPAPAGTRRPALLCPRRAPVAAPAASGSGSGGGRVRRWRPAVPRGAGRAGGPPAAPTRRRSRRRRSRLCWSPTASTAAFSRSPRTGRG